MICPAPLLTAPLEHLVVGTPVRAYFGPNAAQPRACIFLPYGVISYVKLGSDRFYLPTTIEIMLDGNKNVRNKFLIRGRESDRSVLGALVLDPPGWTWVKISAAPEGYRLTSDDLTEWCVNSCEGVVSILYFSSILLYACLRDTADAALVKMFWT